MGIAGESVFSAQAVTSAVPRAADSVATIQRLVSAFSEVHSREQIATILVGEGGESIAGAAVWVALLSDDGQSLELVSTANSHPPARQAWQRIPIGMASPITDAVRSGQPSFFSSPRALVAQYPALAGQPVRRMESIAHLPLTSRGRTIGVLVLAFPVAHGFDEPESTFLVTLASLCAQALDRDAIERERSVRRITERNAAAQSRQGAEIMHELILESAPVGVLVLNDEGVIVVANAKTAELFGYTKDELLGEPVELLVPDDIKQQHRVERRDYLVAGENRVPRLEVDGRRKDGSLFPAEVVLSVAVIDGERLVTAVVRDVTQRRQAEREHDALLAREQAARLAAEAERTKFMTILESASDAILYIDADTGGVAANVLAQEFERELQPANPTGVFCAPDGRRLEFEELVSTRALRGETVTGEELRIRKTDGRLVPALVSGIPVRGPDGAISGAIMLAQDLSYLKNIEGQREEWISVIAHDLRQPVSVIKGFAGLAQMEIDQRPDLARISRAVGHIRSAATHLSQMISDLLDSSLLDSHRLVINPVPVGLRGLIEAAIVRAREAVSSRVVRLEADATLPMMRVDPGRIEQVLGNLITNAEKYGYPDSEIVVTAHAVDAAVEVSVTNRGPGVTPDEAATLFDRFCRSRRTEGSGIEGLGLGLNICKGLVEAHGGRIWVESTPGETTTFTFTIPIA